MPVNTVARVSSGVIGLGSRLFMGMENVSWGTPPTALNDFNIYNQPGQRPVKTTTPIDVPQLFPPMLRRKPMKGSVSVEGSYTFSLPKANMGDFMQLLLGDTGVAVGTETTYALKARPDANLGSSWTIVQTVGDTKVARYTGMKAQSFTLNIATDSVASFDIAFLGKDEEVIDANDADLVSWFGFDSNPFRFGADGRILGWSDSDDPEPGSGTDIWRDGQKANFDQFVDYFPAWSATLRVENLDGNTVAGDAASGDGLDTIIPFSDLSLTVNNALEFPTYISGVINRNEPVQTTYKEVTGTMTVPYNEHTNGFINAFFDQDNFKASITFNDNAGTASPGVVFNLPNFCITGDGGLPDIPEGEVTLPVSFGAYAATETTAVNSNVVYADSNPVAAEAPIVVIVDSALV